MYSVFAILFAKFTMKNLSYKVILGSKVVLFAVSLGLYGFQENCTVAELSC